MGGGGAVQSMRLGPREVFSFLRADELFRDSSIMLVATVLTGGLNYFYQVYVGRALGPVDYGAFGALFAISYLLSIIGQSITLSTVHFVSKFAGEQRSIRGFYYSMLIRSGALGFTIFALIALLSPHLSYFLNIDAPLLVLVVALNFALGMLLPVTLGVVQGLQRFKALGGYQIGSALLKLSFGVLLVSLGYSVLGALAAVLLSTLFTVLLSMGYLHRMLRPIGTQAQGVSFKEVYRFGFSSLLVAFCFTVPANMDVVLVKHFFTPSDAGLYTAATVLAKILIFLPMGISVALFPKISHNRAMRLPTEPLLYRAFLYAGALSGAGALLYLLAPGFVIELLFGARYLEGAHLVRWYGVAIFFFSLVVVLMNYHLSNNTTRFIHFTALLTLIEILLISFLHNTLIQVIQIIIIVNIIILLGGLTGVRRNAIHHRASLQ